MRHGARADREWRRRGMGWSADGGLPSVHGLWAGVLISSPRTEKRPPMARIRVLVGGLCAADRGRRAQRCHGLRRHQAAISRAPPLADVRRTEQLVQLRRAQARGREAKRIRRRTRSNLVSARCGSATSLAHSPRCAEVVPAPDLRCFCQLRPGSGSLACAVRRSGTLWPPIALVAPLWHPEMGISSLRR